MIYAFDLDGTLCETKLSDYTNSKPMLERIQKVNQLKCQGNTILIFTARGTTSRLDLRDFTESQLRSWGLLFDQLILGKPSFDLLVDDKAIHSESFTWDLRK